MSGSPSLGFRKYMQFGRESTWGTEVNATHRLPIIRESLKTIVGQVRRPDLNNSLFRSGIVNVTETVAGQIELLLSYQALNLIWDGLFGTDTFGSNGGSTTGTNPYTHTFVPKQYRNSYTIEIMDGFIGTDTCKLITGAKFTGFTIRAEAGDGESALARLTLDVVGKRSQPAQTPTGSLTAVTQTLVVASHLSAFDDGTADSTNSVRMVECSMQSSTMHPRPQVGTIYTDEPIRNDFPVATMKYRKERQSTSLMTAYQAGTSMDPSVTFTTTGSLSLKFQMDVSKIVDLVEDTDGYGIQYQDVTYEGIDSGSSFDMKVIAVNAQALITT